MKPKGNDPGLLPVVMSEICVATSCLFLPRLGFSFKQGGECSFCFAS